MGKAVWWDVKKGDDAKSGLSQEEAVKTQERVNEILGRDVDIEQSKTGCLQQFPGKDFTVNKA